MKAAGLVRGLRRHLPRRERPTQRAALALASATLVLGTVLSILDDNTEIKIASIIIIVMVLASLILSTAGMLIQLALVVCCLVAVFAVNGVTEKQLSVSGFVMIVVTSLVGVLQARRRDALGLREVSAETVLGLISERLVVQAQLPQVPDGWIVEVAQRPADGAVICGDFVASRLVAEDGTRVLHLVVVDVSGNGISAGPRALPLSGAVGGLLGSVPPDELLPAANDFLARQQWSLGFASAVYLRLDLETGEYGLRVAGHPPAMQYRPDAVPSWRMSEATGTVLGVLPELTSRAELGVLQPGAALFLYTDGVIEDRTRDLDAGAQRFRETVELLTGEGEWAGAAGRLVERVPVELTDDRTVVVIRRDPTLDLPALDDVVADPKPLELVPDGPALLPNGPVLATENPALATDEPLGDASAPV